MFGNTEDQLRLMFGQYTIHVPMWMVVQDQDPVVTFVGASRDLRLRYGSERTHQLILGEMVIRPHVVIATDHYTGTGLSGMVNHGPQINEWVKHGEVICDPMGKCP